VLKFADALESIPLTLAENAGMDPIDTQVDIRAKHGQGKKWFGINVTTGKVSDMMGDDVVEPTAVKEQIIAPLHPSHDDVDHLPEQRMKWVGNMDRCSQISGAACSWSIARKLGASIRPRNNCGGRHLRFFCGFPVSGERSRFLAGQLG
jgi:hypothetical protein